MKTYRITAVRGRKVVELRRVSVAGALRTVARLRELGWSVAVSP